MHSSRKSFFALAGAGAFAAALPRAASAADTIRVGMIPDAGATQVSIDEKAPLREFLARHMQRLVDLIIPTNYNATVEALGNGSLDFAYLGGLTYLQAHARYGVIPLVQRVSDRAFHSLFITQTDSPLKALADLKGKTFAFGDVNSTSGHLMPYAALQAAGIDADADLKFRYTGSHPATLKAVEAGTVAAGAMDESVYASMMASGQADKNKIRVFYRTPPFLDYVWVARKDLAPSEQFAFATSFLALTEAKNKPILDILRGTKFVRANDGEYNELRRIATKLKML
ncbi:MAG: phosphate/phosphite/phosphonate ABC transporter substrate-binding protein [Candidatus Eremiobacteraeota bacterium]|nr:phosphate/phosphite/phosphonate ABC transporter substrate-binding protein [Candidatus Eremiobacteraeota bacterium]